VPDRRSHAGEAAEAFLDKQLVVKTVRRLPDDVDEEAPAGMTQVKG